MCYFTVNVIQSAFSDAGLNCSCMPQIDILSSWKIIHCSLESISHDKSSNADNLAVLKNIFWDQYHLSDHVFDKQLCLIYDDQKTIWRLRILKRHCQESEKSFDCLQWMLPVPALFHLKMNLLYTISKTHFEKSDRD